MKICYICKNDIYENGYHIPRYVCNYRVCVDCYFEIIKYINDKHKKAVQLNGKG